MHGRRIFSHNLVAMAQVTLVYPLYRSARLVPKLFEALTMQRHPEYSDQTEWLEAIFIDDASDDGTSEAVLRELRKIGSPKNYRLETLKENRGLAGNLNWGFRTARSPYLVSVQTDCFFVNEDYVYTVLQLFAQHPEVAAIAGQPEVPKNPPPTLVEKINLVTNLMDLFPPETEQSLVPVGFAEGRCDGFRKEALERVGFYPDHLHSAGEDQVLAARLRNAGYQVCLAPRLRYYLGASSSQDSLWKLLTHQMLFGRVHPTLVLKNKVKQGVAGKGAGSNRKKRLWLRLSQVTGALSLMLGTVATFLNLPWAWAPWGMVLGMRVALLAPHAWRLSIGIRGWFVLLAIQPFLDLAYFSGLLQGVYFLIRPARGSIS